MKNSAVLFGGVLFLLTSLGHLAMGAAVSGKVFFNGVPPVMPVVSMTKEKFCQKAHARAPQHEEFVVVNSNKTLRSVVVYIRSGLKQKAFLPPHPVVLDQVNCWFKPHVLAVAAGQTIKAINNDPGVLHNFHFMCHINPPLNFSEQGEDQGGRFPFRNIVFHRPEMIPLICDIHPWMNAVVAVLPNPYFDVTGKDGTFIIPNLPPGHYTLEAWQEKYGAILKKITVRRGQSVHVDFIFQDGKKHS